MTTNEPLSTPTKEEIDEFQKIRNELSEEEIESAISSLTKEFPSIWYMADREFAKSYAADMKMMKAGIEHDD